MEHQAESKMTQIKTKRTLVRGVRDYQLYVLALPAIIYLFIFHYIPMYGVTIAFKDFNAIQGILGSPWVGIEHFQRFFNSFQFWLLIRNTLVISFYQLIAGFPAPIILALLLNQTRNKRFKSWVQTITYAPHFISVVVFVGMIFIFLSPRTGFINHIIVAFGGDPILFMGESAYFKSIYVLSGVWQQTGWASIIYLAALSAINPELHEAARVDGASKWKQICHIDLPGIMPTAIVLLILNAGQLMNVGFQKLYLMQTPLTESSQEILATYIYKIGLISSQFSYSAAINLFNSLINIVLLIMVNYISRRVSDTSLW